MLLLLKLVAPPLLIALVAVVSRRWGTTLGGLLAALPLTSGPMSVFFALEHGRAFAAEAAIGSIDGSVAVGAFCIGYTLVASAPRSTWARSLTAGLAGFAAAVLLLDLVHPPLIASVALAAAWLSLVLLGSEHVLRELEARAPPAIRCARASGGGALALRMVVGGIIVVVITGAARVLGATLAGLVGPLPVVSGVTSVAEHRARGARDAVSTLAGTAAGTVGFAAFFLVVALLISAEPMWLAYGAATIAALIGTVLGRMLARWLGGPAVENAGSPALIPASPPPRLRRSAGRR